MLTQLSSEVGLSKDDFKEALLLGMYREVHQEALKHAYEEANITAVPTLIIGDEMIQGLASKERLAQIIDEQLKKINTYLQTVEKDIATNYQAVLAYKPIGKILIKIWRNLKMSVTTTNVKEAIINRRSIRKVQKNEMITKERINDVLKTAVHAPSSFNMQSARVIVVMDKEHNKFWDIVKETLRLRVPAENFAATVERLQGFKEGVGTILFFENQETIKQMQENAPSYKEQFPYWSHQGSAMLQYATWLSLSAEGIGASIQHYNPIIDEEVKQTWDIPSEWSLIAQMPFGEPNEQPGEKASLPFEDIVKFY